MIIREREGIMKHMIVKNTGRNLNAEDLINDQYHYIINKKEELLGYIIIESDLKKIGCYF